MEERIDLSMYREDGDDRWYREEVDRVGAERIDEMADYLYKHASRLPVGGAIDIVKLCRDPQNRRIAVRIGCEIINTANTIRSNKLRALLTVKPDASLEEKIECRNGCSEYEFNETYTLLRRVR